MPLSLDSAFRPSRLERDLLEPRGPGPYETPYDVRRGYQDAPELDGRGLERDTLFFLGAPDRDERD